MIMKKMIFILRSLFFIPHLLVCVIAGYKEIVIQDAENTIRPLGLSYSGTKAVLWLLENDRFFRTMFYQRLGILSNLICNNIECKVNREKFYSATMYYNWK